jgi:hypothetical protein
LVAAVHESAYGTKAVWLNAFVVAQVNDPAKDDPAPAASALSNHHWL